MMLPKPLFLRRGIVALLLCLSLCGQGTSVLAATTGAITGTIVDASTKAAIAGATVTAVSPSQTAHGTTDSAGRFTIFNLAPDTYTVSVQKEGYEPLSSSGVGVFANQQQNLSLSVPKVLRTIARVTTRSPADLINSGRTTDAYTITPATAAAASALGGGGSLNQAYSALASAPGVYIPQNQSGSYQSVYIRGGNYTELGYELDGIPIQRAFDQYPASALSALGQQNLQVYAGSGPLDAQSSGLAGFIDQVIKTGTYPGYVHFQGSLGSPTFYHQGEIEVGGASPNRNFSYYVASAGYNQEYRFVDNQNGASLNNTFGNPYNLVHANCAGLSATIGCYTNSAGNFGFPDGPAGYAFGPFQFGANNQVSDRESIVNLHYGIPHKDGTRDDIQLLYDHSSLSTIFQNSVNDWAYAKNDVINGTATYNGVTYPGCTGTTTGPANCALLGPDRQTYVNTSIYTGPFGVPLTPGLLGAAQRYYY
ncbi:MAG: carboxypeptidase regulatory-like domain-containing protein, partial [Candidatus Eremiobacteraeota bacterium]|nr:carboxypeptidase regulatory-like domain-containing protein [Candidatus Eremiobacteraeota bacterium]